MQEYITVAGSMMERRLHLGYTLKVEMKVFADEMNVGGIHRYKEGWRLSFWREGIKSSFFGKKTFEC